METTAYTGSTQWNELIVNRVGYARPWNWLSKGWKDMRQAGIYSVRYGAGIVLSQSISFLMLPIYTRFLSPADYGVMELIELALDLIATVAGARIAVGIFRYYHKARDVESQNAVVSTAFGRAMPASRPAGS